MAITVEKGGQYTAHVVRSGTNARGNWEMIVTRDEKGKKEAVIFADNNPSGVIEGDNFILEEITSFSVGAKKGKDGVWRDTSNVTGKVKPVPRMQAFGSDDPFGASDPFGSQATFTELTGDDDGQLPF